MRLTHRTGSCKNGPCDNVFDYEPMPDKVAIQGSELTDPEALAQLDQKPEHETVVLVSRELILEYARTILAEEQPA